MRSAAGGPRVLLRRLREVMAEPVSVQDRLNKIVVLIAVNMVAEVCSLYVLRIDGSLELFATEGLRPESVHVTVLRPDEGLVGLVASDARALNLSDAQQHPAFSFRPETGEEIYHSFLGVPILRAGNTLGVLTVQNRAYRSYSEDEEEALQTTAMVLAETIASGELSSRPSEPRPSASELSFKRPPPAPRGPNIFISYRRSDTPHITGRIYDRLAKEIPEQQIFLDVDAIPYGVDFKQHISATINRTAVMLTVIGAHWANRSWWVPRWFRWLGSAEDFVRSEIEAALDAGVPIIPVLIDGAPMPTVGKLPSSISELA